MDFKKTLLIICLFVGLNTFAQNRLEFNQVLTIDTAFSQTFSPGTQTYYGDYHYVPAGKVWKIESFFSNGTMQINDVDVAAKLYYAGSQSSQNVAVEPVSFPIWLKSGDKIRYRFWHGGNHQSISFLISALEFNIVTD
jgi:hypothetical protein